MNSITTSSQFSTRYKKFIKLKINYFNEEKILNFKKFKWLNFLEQFKRFDLMKKYDHSLYYKFKYSFYYKTKFKFNMYKTQNLKFYLGNLRKKCLKKKIIVSLKNFHIKHCTKNNVSVKQPVNLFLIECFEKQLFITIFRSFFVNSVRKAKQIIFQGNVFVNNKKIYSPNYILTTGDVISFSDKYSNILKNNVFEHIEYVIKKKRSVIPSFLKVCYSSFQICLIKDIKLSKNYNNYPFLLETRHLINYKKL